MNIDDIRNIVSGGETTEVQFKRELDNHDKLAAELIDFIQADRMPVAETSIADVEALRVRAYIEKVHPFPSETIDTMQLYNNLGILKDSRLTLGGLLFFANRPQRFRSAFGVKAIAFFGNSLGGLDYRDSRDIEGPISELYEGGMNFFRGLLRHQQKGQNFNSLGILEISEIALQELMLNALIHRDYTINSPVRLMIFDNRIEIVSPGCLPNSLTVEKIKNGQAVVRNNLIISFCAKLMTYRGFGTGIIRAIEHQPDIEFVNDLDGEQFIVRIPRPASE